MSEPLAVEVDVIAEFADLPGDPAELAELVTHALAAEGQAGAWSVAVVLTSDERLRALHRDFMGIDSETDVMTFPSEPEPGGEGCGGDIVISVDRAAEHAAELGHGAWDEVRFLAVHGTLHLCGWDDADDADRARMLERQREIIGGWGLGAGG